jgi:O-antigen/teichoic acid export membrane protein
MSSSDPAGMTSASPPQQAPAGGSGRHFITNVLWNWLGAISTIGAGILLQPYIIRQLGAARYGIWALVFSTLDYLRLFDFGLRSSIVNFTARCRARHDYERLNDVLSTAAVYFGFLAAAIIAFSLSFCQVFPSLFKVPDSYRADAVALAAIVGVSVAIGLFSSVFTGVLEAFQRFDLVNHAYTAALFARMAGSVALLYFGYGLVELGALALLCQIGERVWNIRSVWRIVPEIHLRPSRASFSTLRTLTGYSFSSFLVSNAILISNQSPLVLIGYFSSAASVGFFSLPYRLVMYIGDIVPRVGTVTASKVAELDEHGHTGQLQSLAVLINRYCYMLFMPLAIFLLIFGHELLSRLVNPEFAESSAGVLPLVTILVTITIAGMFNTVATLVGQGRHRLYAWGVTAEIAVYIAALAWSIPRYGIMGAAWSSLCVLTLSRGLMPAWIFCRQNGCSLPSFLASIYAAPTLTAVPAAAIGVLLEATYLSGGSWPELITAGAIIAGVYYSLALFTCVSAGHRHGIRVLAERQFRRLRPSRHL